MQTTETQPLTKDAAKEKTPQNQGTSEPPWLAKPQEEHHWLHQMVGRWSGEGEAAMDPGKPPEKWTTDETVRSLGGLWIIAEAEGQMPGGGTSQTVMTLGYDAEKKKYVGTFAASMMTKLWSYVGSLDADRKVLTLDTEGPSMNGKTARYKDVITLKSNDERTMISEVLGEDGKWREVMTATYRRKK